MPSRPAVAQAATPSRLGTIHRRLVAYLEGLPGSTRDLLTASLLPADFTTPPSVACRNDFYWLLLPEWLGGDLDDDVLDDILWAQYTVYCLFRALDDVVDGDAPDPHLAVAAGYLTAEAGRTLRRHFGHETTLWAWFDTALAETSDALTALDLRQARAARQGDRDLTLFARLSRCLTLASRAVVERTSAAGDWPLWLAVLDRLAIAGQMLDDFHDMKADLACGQVNYATWFFTQPVIGTSVEATEAIIATTLATSDRLPRFFARVDQELAAAAALVPASGDPRISEYLARFRRTTAELELALDARQQRLFRSA